MKYLILLLLLIQSSISGAQCLTSLDSLKYDSLGYKSTHLYDSLLLNSCALIGSEKQRLAFMKRDIIQFKDVKIPKNIDGISSKIPASHHLLPASKADGISRLPVPESMLQNEARPGLDILGNTSALDEAMLNPQSIQLIDLSTIPKPTGQTIQQTDALVASASKYFANKEKMLENDINDIGKLQLKYRSFKDARYLPKHRYDELRGRPFIERFYINGSLQFDQQASNKVFIDVSPGIGYNILSVFRVGAGASYRFDYNTKEYAINARDRVIKIRGFADYKFFKDVFFHLEYERTHTKLPDYLSKQTGSDPSEVQWVPMAYVGIFKVQKLSKRISGQVTVLYDFLKVQQNYNFNKVTSRIGLEYKLR